VGLTSLWVCRMLARIALHGVSEPLGNRVPR
jgi:hypothetical protein